MKYTVYSTNKSSYIQPAERNVPSTALHQWEIETDYAICDKKLKLSGHISNIDQIADLLKKLLIDIRDIPLTEGDSAKCLNR